MKALSLKQPWANLIAQGHKTIETRTWSTNYRGPLLVCASKTIDQDAAAWLGIGPYPCGCAVAMVELAECRLMVRADEDAACCAWEPGRFAWILKDVRPIEPFPVRGQLGLFEVEMPDAARGPEKPTQSNDTARQSLFWEHL